LIVARYIDFRPVFDELNRRKVVLYSHPADSPCCGNLIPGVGSGTVDWETDTARTIFSLLANGSATRYGDIRFIFSHGGGTMPSLSERFGVGGPDNFAENLAKPAEKDSRLTTCGASITTPRGPQTRSR
jgi:hypothetical protein